MLSANLCGGFAPTPLPEAPPKIPHSEFLNFVAVFKKVWYNKKKCICDKQKG